ncbi:hypothetical protein FRB99_003140 [Tulasnella sp. 403]|nr:hypothetical protein FRB99_003140 [Tulasnella sp. 403]
MSDSQGNPDDPDDADQYVVGSTAAHGYSSDVMSERPPSPPSDGQDSNEFRNVFESEPATGPGTPPASSSYSISDEVSNVLYSSISHQVKHAD